MTNTPQFPGDPIPEGPAGETVDEFDEFLDEGDFDDEDYDEEERGPSHLASWAERLEASRRRRARILVVGGGIALIGLMLGPAGRRWLSSDDDDNGGGNGDPTAVAEAPDHYRITYRVADGFGVVEVSQTVDRPFAGLEMREPVEGDVEGGERYTALGYALTREPGDDWSGVVGITTALDEARFDATLRDAERVGLLVPDEVQPTGEILGRSCRRYFTGAPLDEEPAMYDVGAPVQVVLCIDDQTDLVLEERVEEDGALVRHTVASSIEIEPVFEDAELRQPTEPLDPVDGGGEMARVRPDQRANAIEAWHIPTPGSYEFVDRYFFLEPTLGVLPTPVDATTLPAQTVDVFLRNEPGRTDTVLLFQGQDPDLPEPPPWAEVVETDSDAGTVTEIVGLGFNEIRFEATEGTFARIVGTVPMSELRGLAQTAIRSGAL